MPIREVTLTFDGINDSIQVGDTAYFSLPQAGDGGGFDVSNRTKTRKLGEIVGVITNTWNIGEGKLKIRYDDSKVTFPPSGEIPFMSFVKDKKANTTSLLGYYAEAKFVNNSIDKAELFSVGSEVTESSK
tara:strand:+ start:7987 stop:8376 length:390 start_codon:yes stop_codon:yes gene_type:complete